MTPGAGSYVARVRAAALPGAGKGKGLAERPMADVTNTIHGTPLAVAMLGNAPPCVSSVETAIMVEENVCAMLERTPTRSQVGSAPARLAYMKQALERTLKEAAERARMNPNMLRSVLEDCKGDSLTAVCRRMESVAEFLRMARNVEKTKVEMRCGVDASYKTTPVGYGGKTGVGSDAARTARRGATARETMCGRCCS